MAETQTVWNETNLTDLWQTIQAGGLPPLSPLPNVPGCSIRISNNSAYFVNVVQSGTGIAVDDIEPFSYLIMPNTPDLSLQLDGSRPASSLSPDTQAVTFSTMAGSKTYQKGSTTFSGTSNVTVNGPVTANISNSLLNVSVSGTVQANITNATINANITNATIPVSGSVSANITNATLNVGGSVAANITNANIPVTGTVTIDSSSPVNIQAAQAVPITNTSGGVLQVGGTIEANITNATIPVSGSVNATISNASIPVTQASGSTFNANITNATLNANITNASIPVTGTVTAAISNASIPVTQASGSTFNANITNASMAVTGNVNATIQNTSIAVTQAAGATFNANITNASIPVSGSVNATIQNASIPVTGTVSANITNASIPVSGSVSANITNASIPVTGTVSANITNSTVNVQATNAIPVTNDAGGQLTVAGSVTANLPAGTAVDINTGSVQITNAVQTNNLVQVGTFTIPVSELANTETVSGLLTGNVTGYWQTLILEGQSQNGYTYNAACSAYNRSTNIGTPTLTQSNGPSGQFYASGNLSARQAFSNVDVTLTAEVSTTATIFQDAMTAGTNWATEAGSVTYGANGATFGANGTVLTETTQTGLEPQNLTLQSKFTVSNVVKSYGQSSPVTISALGSGITGYPEGNTQNVVLLTNGWLVATYLNNNTGYICFDVSTNGGATWSQLCYIAASASYDVYRYAIGSYGTKVYCYRGYDGNFYSFDATTVTNTNLSPYGSGVTAAGSNTAQNGVSMYVDSNGYIYIAAGASTGTVYYAGSTNAGVSFSSPMSWSASIGSGGVRPQVFAYNGEPYVFVNEYSSTYTIELYRGLGGCLSTGSAQWATGVALGSGSFNPLPPQITYYSGKFYVFTQDDTSGLALSYWTSADGITWSAKQSITWPSNYMPDVLGVYTDASNNLVAVGVGVDTNLSGNGEVQLWSIAMAPTGTWGSVNWITTSSTTNSEYLTVLTCPPSGFNITSPIMVWFDSAANSIKFMGTWTQGSHSTAGVMYWNPSNAYYLLQWYESVLNLIEDNAGTLTTLATVGCTETATSVTATLVIASNGNITGTLTGNQTTQVTATNTDITSGQLAVTGDSGVVASNAFISGNYIPSDIVTITAYAA